MTRHTPPDPRRWTLRYPPIPALTMHVERTYDDVYGWIEVSPAGSGGVR